MEVVTVSYNGSGTFQINTSGQPVVTGTVISSSAFNALTADLATGLSTALTKDGQTTATARIPFAQGITSTLVTDSSSTSTGSIITAGGVGIAKNLYVGVNANIAGTLSVTGSTTLTNPVINNIKMGYSTTATAAGTTTLTVSSNYRQFFTGTLAQTIVLPVTSTLVTGMAFEIENNSTGTLTVNSSGGNLVGTVPAGVCAHAVCIGITLTTAADWDWDYISTTTITGTGANVLGTSPTITSATLVTPALGTPTSGSLVNCTDLNYTGFKNRIINGGFAIWQRGTTYALPTTANYGSADRWAFWQATSANGVANQVASGLAGFQYAIKLGRNSGATTTGGVVATQAFETVNSLDLAGQSITFSFYAKAGANFSASGNSISCVVSSGTGTDQSVVSLNAGTWTGAATVLSSSPAITTSWVRYTFTGTVASNATQVGLQIYYIPTGTAGSDDNLYITGVQLEKGSTATSFDYRPYGTELQLCQRYFWNYTGFGNGAWANGQCDATTNARLFIKHPVPMRASPSLSYTGTPYVTNSITGAANITAFGTNYGGTVSLMMNATVAAGLVAGNATIAGLTNSTDVISITAEL
jgi:hypothetical protein